MPHAPNISRTASCPSPPRSGQFHSDDGYFLNPRRRRGYPAGPLNTSYSSPSTRCASRENRLPRDCPTPYRASHHLERISKERSLVGLFFGDSPQPSPPLLFPPNSTIPHRYYPPSRRRSPQNKFRRQSGRQNRPARSSRRARSAP